MLSKLKQNIREFIYRRYNISFSKAGEDIQLNKLLGYKRKGVFIDIGCWHPIKASNTYYFSLRNWKGICIDPNPDLKNLYHKYRPNDVFVNCGVGAENSKKLKYYMVKQSSMNTFDLSFLEERNLINDIVKVEEIPIMNLSNILKQTLSPNDTIDFFDIDVEGYDLAVLKSNNWEHYRPKIVMVETNLSLANDIDSELNNYMESVNYELVAKSIMNAKSNTGNLLFIDKFHKYEGRDQSK